MRLATRLTRRPEACQWSKTNSCKRFAVWLKRSPDTTMLKLTAPVLRNAATSRARLQTGRFCALSPPENTALAQPPRSSKAAFWRFPPVQRTDVEGQQRGRFDPFGVPFDSGRYLRNRDARIRPESTLIGHCGSISSLRRDRGRGFET